jgi:hypothetical protein
MLNSKVLTDDIFRREIKSLDRDEIALCATGCLLLLAARDFRVTVHANTCSSFATA